MHYKLFKIYFVILAYHVEYQQYKHMLLSFIELASNILKI